MSGRYDRPLSPEQIAAVKDEKIDFSDIPELDEEFWERAELVEPDRTDQITMRVKRSVLAYFKAPPPFVIVAAGIVHLRWRAAVRPGLASARPANDRSETAKQRVAGTGVGTPCASWPSSRRPRSPSP